MRFGHKINALRMWVVTMEAMLEFRREIVKTVRDLNNRYPNCKVTIPRYLEEDINNIEGYLDIEYLLSKPTNSGCHVTTIEFWTDNRVCAVSIWEDQYYIEHQMYDQITETQETEWFGKQPDVKVIKEILETIPSKLFEQGFLKYSMNSTPNDFKQ